MKQTKATLHKKKESTDQPDQHAIKTLPMSLNTMHICLPCRRRLLLNSTRNKTASFSHSSRSYTRPSFAPKPVIDIRHIRNAPGLYEQNCIDRNYKHQSRHSWRILELHNQWQDQQASSRKLRERNNVLKKQLANFMARTDDAGLPTSKDELLEEAKQLKTQLVALDAKEHELKDEIDTLALELPNLSSTNTPNGDIPKVLEYLNPFPENTPPDRPIRSHVDIGQSLDLLDFSASAITSGWGWYFLKNEAALLEHALVQYALTTALSRGWNIVTPPSLVYSHIAHACGFQPRDANGEHQIYTIAQPEKDRDIKPTLCLTGTAEIPFAGMKANTILEATELPLKVIGASRCYRAEAGARGVDTKGLYRVHEFTKVEMFAWTLPDSSTSLSEEDLEDDDNPTSSIPEHFAPSTTSASELIFDEMVALQKHILTSLSLPCRVLEQPAADLGASATRKIDIEAWFPSRYHSGKQDDPDAGWGEVTSASTCTDYQTRRLATRVKMQGGARQWPWTVNGTAMAVPRVLAAVMENGWDEATESLTIPEVLRPWMGGLERIVRK